MSREDPDVLAAGPPRLFCDLTQSWSEVGGGVRTYLLHKRRHILDNTPHSHLLIVPGSEDKVVEEGRAITVAVRSPHVPGSPNYRLMLRNGAVRKALERFQPHFIECQDSYNLPWAAIGHRKRYPATALVGSYCTDFPTVYVERPFAKVLSNPLAGLLGRVCYRYAGFLYRRFDAVFALSENGGAAKLRSYGVPNVDVVGLGVELGDFSPQRRDPKLRRSLGVSDEQPLLIYVGRLDGEKKAEVVVDAFQRLPEELGATLMLLGEGPLRPQFQELAKTRRIRAPGYVRDRSELARWLASADIYVSAMADETFGISIVEAQASGLPVVGVAGGAMIDRVGKDTGRLGPVGDAAAMAENILAVWNGDRATMSEHAQALAREHSWDNSMRALFGRIYPAALARSVERQVAAGTAAAGALVRA